MVDEDNVPMLVDARDVEDEARISAFNTTQRRESSTIRVPLTIITGMGNDTIRGCLFT